MVCYEPFFTETPAISPDGELIAFVYMNDLWEVPFEGGVARRLTANNDRVWRPSYSPNGQHIVFHSDRNGRANLYRIPATGGQAELLISEELTICDWYADGQALLAIGSEPGERSNFFRIELNDKRPLEIGILGNNFSTISPDNSCIVFNRRGLPYRPAYEGSHVGNLWFYNIATKEYKQITSSNYSDRYPKFSSVIKDRIYYVGSDSHQFQLYYIDNFDENTKTQLTHFDDWSVRTITIARRNDRIVFEYFNEIWRYDPDTGKSEKVIIEILEDDYSYSKVHESNKNGLTNFYVSPNQEFMVFSYKFDLFAVPLQSGKVKQLSTNQKGYESIVVMDDNRTIYFISYHNGIPKLFKTDILNTNNMQMVDWFSDKYVHQLYKNNDGELIIYYDQGNERTNRRVYASINSNNKITEILPGEMIESYPLFSSDKTKMIYISSNLDNNTYTTKLKEIKTNRIFDIHVSKDLFRNLILTKSNNQIVFNKNNSIHLLELALPDTKKNDIWGTILNTNQSPTKNAPSTWDINSENFLLRENTLVTESGYTYPLFTTVDSLVYYITHVDAKRILKKVKFDGSQKEELLTINGRISSYQLFEDKLLLYYIVNENLYSYNIKNKTTKIITFEHDYIYDNIILNKDIFDQIWGRFGHYFYDSNMHDQDWNYLYQKFSPYINSIRTVEQLRKIVDELIGRVNASHTGFTTRQTHKSLSLERAYIGLVLDYSQRLPVGMRIKRVYFHSDIHQKYNISENDILLEINGTSIYDNTEIAPLLINLVGKDIYLKIQKRTGIIDIDVKGISWSEQYKLWYDDFVLNNYRKVQAVTDGRVGYLHIQRMNQSSLRKFEHDFFAVNINTDALIIDVRGNTGGNISNQLIELITRQQTGYSYGRAWGIELMQYPRQIYQKPIVCLIDEDSYSDAEVFSGAFQDLKLGFVVGMPTSGSVIGTGQEDFMDGSSIRMPRHGWFRLNKKNQELNGTEPDVYVPLLPHHILNNHDIQLEKAIEILLDILNK